MHAVTCTTHLGQPGAAVPTRALASSICGHFIAGGKCGSLSSWLGTGFISSWYRQSLRALGLILSGGRSVSNPTANFSAGDIVGNYKILGLAGAGGMGVVYRALDVKLERTVALKFLPEHVVSSHDDKERFLREARTASSLDHPNIGVIHGLEEPPDGRTFIVMAYYAGEPLVRRIRRPLSLGEAID